MPEASRPRRRVLDGAAFGVYDDSEPRGRWPQVLAAVVGIAVVAVGLLVWRAVRTDADLVLPATEATTTTSSVGVVPTGDAVMALVPDGLDTCVAPEHGPDDGPPRAAAVCPRDGEPETIVFVLYATLEDRDAEFGAVVEEFGVPSSGADCALGQSAVHDYIGFDRVGRLACLSGTGVVDFVWTSDEAPLLVRARGPGSFVDHYAFWDRIVDRTDAAFPVPAERALLARLPYDPGACRRDLELNVDAAGRAAVACELDDAEARLVSAVQFEDVGAMSTWIEAQRASLTDNVVGDHDDACTASGFGRRTATEATGTDVSTQAPDAGFAPYDIDGSTGRVLCFMSSSGENVVAWVRDGSLIGSIAVSDGASPATMRELLTWWAGTGHRP